MVMFSHKLRGWHSECNGLFASQPDDLLALPNWGPLERGPPHEGIA